MGGLAAVIGSLAIAAAAPLLHETREALTGWLFLVGSSLSVLIVAGSPHGMAEVHRLLSSTIIGANEEDVAIVALLLVATVATLAWKLTDPETAAACGVPVRRWERIMAVWLGLAVAWSIHVAGMIFTFGCLVLPALVAKSVSREVRSLFFVAPVVALVVAMAGFVVSNDLDLPPGQVTVAMLAFVQVGAWGLRRRRKAH
jgi:zinc/manganese transport system permease protein